MYRSAMVWLIPLALVVPSTADAHFILSSPASVSQQDEFGSPQKSAPCGNTDTAGVPDEATPTNQITTVPTGSMLTISIRETIFHPGHYRVALAQDRASLPADPAVTAGSTACGSTQIAANPTLPVLGDGLLRHTSSLGNTMQTMQVQLPAGMTCTSCVLQVTQFMSNHALNNPGGCYYHHCATLTIADNAPAPDAGTGTEDPAGGCCNTGPATPHLAALAGLVLGVLGLRRRRRRP